MEKDVDKKTGYINPERMQDMTDGIFAFSMTLLIVSIDFPLNKGGATEDYVVQTLTNMLPTILNFTLAFIIIGLFWYVHHKQFNYMRRTTEMLFWINIITLLFVVFLPFSTDVMDSFGDFKIATSVFNLNMFLVASMFYLQWVYAIKSKLLDERVSKEHLDHARKRNLVFVIVTFLALISGLFFASNSTYAYLIIPVALFIMDRNYKKNYANV